MEKADAPPPEGSTATKTCAVFFVGSRKFHTIGTGFRSRNSSISLAGKAFSEPSAEMPRLSRSLVRARRVFAPWGQETADNGNR